MEVRAAGIIIFRKISKDIEYLLLQASYGQHHWTPPKGHVDKGESDFEAALRETREEVGYCEDDLKIIPDFLKVLKYQVNNKPKVVTYWLAKLCINKPVTLSNEHKDYKWINLNEACRMVEHSNFQELLKECEKFLQEHCTILL